MVTLYPARDTLTAYGSKTSKHLTADATFTNVPAKIMLRPSSPEEQFGQKQFVETYDIYVDDDIGQVHNGDVLKDENSKIYTIVSYRNRERIDELSVMECQLRPWR